jgi:hypothetical protein
MNRKYNTLSPKLVSLSLLVSLLPMVDKGRLTCQFGEAWILVTVHYILVIVVNFGEINNGFTIRILRPHMSYFPMLIRRKKKSCVHNPKCYDIMAFRNNGYVSLQFQGKVMNNVFK